MPNKIALLQEAYRRGILPPNKVAMYEAAVKRGLITEQPEQPEQQPGPPMQQREDWFPDAPNTPMSEDPGMPWMDVAKGVDRNFIPGVGKMIMSGLTAIANPEETFYNAKDLVTGVAQKFTKGTQDKEHLADQAWESLKKPYTSMRAFKETLAEDPARIAGDLAGVVSGGAGITAKAAPLVRGLGRAAAKTAKGAKRVASDTAATAAVSGPKAALLDMPDIVKYGEPLTTFDKAVKTGMGKGLDMPKPPGKHATYSSMAKHHKTSSTGVRVIMDRRHKMSIKDKNDTVISRVPETVDEFAQSIEQGRQLIYKDIERAIEKTSDFRTKRPDNPYPINKHPKSAYGKALEIDLTQTSTKLDKFVASRPMQDFSKGVTDYAWERKDMLAERATPKRFKKESLGYSAAEAEESIKILNQSLDAYYSDRTPLNKGKAMVDAVIADDFRFQLDKMVTEATGTGLTALKKEYGSLKYIEQSVLKQAARLAKEKGGPDLLDVFVGHEVIGGVLTGSLPMLGAGGTVKALHAYRKHIRNPNTHVKKMFKTLEKVHRR